jgi:hypothetical protein
MDWGPMVANAIGWIMLVLWFAGVIETFILARRGKF